MYIPKEKEWLHKNDEDIFVPTEGEVLIKRCIEDSINSISH